MNGMPWSEALKSRCFVWHLPTFTYSHARATDSRLAVFCSLLFLFSSSSTSPLISLALSTPIHILWIHSSRAIHTFLGWYLYQRVVELFGICQRTHSHLCLLYWSRTPCRVSIWASRSRSIVADLGEWMHRRSILCVFGDFDVFARWSKYNSPSSFFLSFAFAENIPAPTVAVRCPVISVWLSQSKAPIKKDFISLLGSRTVGVAVVHHLTCFALIVPRISIEKCQSYDLFGFCHDGSWHA